MIDWSTLPLWALWAAFFAAAGAVAWAGSKLAGVADRFADRTGLGEAVTGGVLLGVATSLSGITASVTAAADGYASMALSNAVGGIAIQSVFLAVADMFLKGKNLEHAAASPTNLTQAGLLVLLLGLLLLATTGPQESLTVFGVHAATPAILIAYAMGMRVVVASRAKPMWRPRRTTATVPDEPERPNLTASLPKLVLLLVVLGVVVTLAGVTIARAGGQMVDRLGMDQSIVGGLFLAASTSLSELVTTIAAVRRGALTLAVGDIVGGNAFDVLFVCVADMAYRSGSLYGDANRSDLFLVALTLVMNVVLMLGLLGRQQKGPAKIGWEGVLVIALYLGGFYLLATGF